MVISLKKVEEKNHKIESLIDVEPISDIFFPPFEDFAQIDQWKELSTKDFELPFENKFLKEIGTVEYTGLNYVQTQTFMDEIKYRNDVMKFYCRIEKTLRGNIMIGVVDLNEQKEARSSYKTGNAICFNALNGIVHYGLKVKAEGNGIFES